MKKGFTLIEILAVIVVLAIISVIAVPTLIGVINKARLNALKNSAYGLIEASNLYYAQYGSNNYRFDIEGSNITSNDTNRLLSFKGKVKQGTSIIKSNGKTVICVTDGKNSAYKNYNETKVNLISKQICTIPSNTSVVYLDGEATLSDTSEQELVDAINELKSDVDALKNENASLKKQIRTLRSDIETSSSNLSDIYPIGSYYITENTTNPHDLFGGTWEKIEGRILLGSSSNYALGSTGGNTSVSYTPQGSVGNHTLTVNQIPSHSHTPSIVSMINAATADTGGNWYGDSQFHLAAARKTNSTSFPSVVAYSNVVNGIIIGNTGGSQGHNHPFTGTQANINVMNPYKVVNIWKRTV